MAKKKMKKRTTKAARAQILAEMNSKGLTAKQVAKKYSVSAWTVYGWRKKSSGATAKPKSRTRNPSRPPKSITPGPTPAALQSEIRAALPTILREELTRAITTVFGLKLRLIKKAAGRLRRGKRGGKK